MHSMVFKMGILFILGVFFLITIQPALADDNHYYKRDRYYSDDYVRHHRHLKNSSWDRYPDTWEGKRQLINSRVPREGSWAVAESTDGYGRMLYVSEVRHEDGKIKMKFRDSAYGDWNIKAKGHHLGEIERDLRIHGYFDPR